MKITRNPQHRRRGAVAPLVAVLLVPLVGMVAFAVDIGRVTMVNGELQNAADSAALAGVDQLMNGFNAYNIYNSTSALTTAEANARNNARAFAYLNACNDLAHIALPDVDVQFGYSDANFNLTIGTYGATINGHYPNTVIVTLRRDGGTSTNAMVPLFFGSVFGQTKSTVVVKSAAVMMTGRISKLPTGGSAIMLPLTLDYNAWNGFIYRYNGNNKNSPMISNPFQLTDPMAGGKDANGIQRAGYAPYIGSNIDMTYEDSSGNPVYPTDTNGNQLNQYPQLQVFPSPSLAPGNFGWLSMDNSSNSASKNNGVGYWIDHGLRDTDWTAIHTSKGYTDPQTGKTFSDVLFPINKSEVDPSITNPQPGIDYHDNTVSSWKGIPGFKNSDAQMLTPGQSAFLPLFAPAQETVDSSGNVTKYVPQLGSPGTYGSKNDAGQGNDAYYNIVDYVPVTLTTLTGNGNKNTVVALQPNPGATFAPGATLIGVAPAGTNNTGATGVTSTVFAQPILRTPQ